MRILFRILARLPLPVLHALGGGLGWLLWVLPNSRKQTSLRNISACFPERSVEEHRRLARASLAHEMKSILETPFFWMSPVDRLLATVRESHGEELIEEALARGKGVILLTLHLGGWEAPGHLYATRRPLTALYKPQGGTLEQLGIEGRKRTGANLIPTAGGNVRQLAAPVLARNETLYFMPDQDPPAGRGIFAPFFGLPAHSPTLVSRLVQETGAAVLFYYGERLPRGRGYIAHFRAAPPEIASPDLLTSVTAMNAGIEACVRSCPEQYWWGYRRFRRRPPGAGAFYR